MARKPRIHYQGALYHVMVRGNNGERIFNEDSEKRKYLDTVGRYREQIGFRVYAYCIMDNHAHLLIEVTGAPLSQIMQRIQQVYTQWYNGNHERTGHVFQQRYKALLCDKERYLFQIIKYIHNNPVKAGLERGLDYEWSSHSLYLRKGQNQIVDSEAALELFAKNKKKARQEYLELMNKVAEEEVEYLDEEDVITTKKDTIELTQENDNRTCISTEEIIKRICLNEDIIPEELTRKTKIRRIADARKAVVILSGKYSWKSNSELASRLNLSSSMISKIKSGEREISSAVQEIILRFEGKSK